MFKHYTLINGNHSFIFKVGQYGVDLFEAVDSVTSGTSEWLTLAEARQEYKAMLNAGFKLRVYDERI